jgi:NADPH:quinone reductase-like Zn-dependent oxidoreductase
VCAGTWRTYALDNESAFTTIPKEIPVEYAATLAVNPATAYRLLNDFVNLKSGTFSIGKLDKVQQSVVAIVVD